MASRSPAQRTIGQGELPCTTATVRDGPSAVAGHIAPAAARPAIAAAAAAGSRQETRRIAHRTVAATRAVKRTVQPVAPTHWEAARNGVGLAVKPGNPQGNPPTGHRTRRNSINANDPAAARTKRAGGASRNR